jgi:hypothetical protein
MRKHSLQLLSFAMLLSPLAGAAESGRIFCNLGALSRAERARHLELIALLKDKVSEMREASDGYAFRYAPELLPRLAEWTMLETKCCPFIDFQLELEPQPGGSAWLRLRGDEDVKEFVRTDFKPLIQLAREKGRPQ